MARKPRIHFAGALYHVILRGNDRQDIFFSRVIVGCGKRFQMLRIFTPAPLFPLRSQAAVEVISGKRSACDPDRVKTRSISHYEAMLVIIVHFPFLATQRSPFERSFRVCF